MPTLAPRLRAVSCRGPSSASSSSAAAAISSRRMSRCFRMVSSQANDCLQSIGTGWTPVKAEPAEVKQDAPQVFDYPNTSSKLKEREPGCLRGHVEAQVVFGSNIWLRLGRLWSTLFSGGPDAC